MNKDYELFRVQAKQACEQYPTLNYYEDVDKPFLEGTLNLTDDQGCIIDTYRIKIVCSPEYPSVFPFVYETGGRVPLNVDWHVFPDGHCCLSSIPEEIIACNTGITLSSFLEKQVLPYFFNQKYREMNGFFLNERSHGQKGNVEFFQDVFQTNNKQIIIRCLEFIKSHNEPDRVQNCFCGSGNKYRKCHRDAFRTLKPLSPAIIDQFIKFVSSYTGM